MQSCEINTYIEYLKFTDISSWERCRLLMYSIVQVNSKKQLDVKDIIKFNWENNQNDTEIKTEDIKKLKEKAKLIEKQLRDQII